MGDCRMPVNVSLSRPPLAEIQSRLARLIGARPGELLAAMSGFSLFLCLFTGYFMLRPLRDALGIQGGVQYLQWLFTATFLVMLLAVPLFAWLSARVPRVRYVDWVYGLFATNLAGFGLLFAVRPEDVWLARTFYVWISVYNLFVVSVAWSLMADVFDAQQAKRLFAFIAAGASVGGLFGPVLIALLVGSLGAGGLLGLAAVLLLLALGCKRYLMGWREWCGAGRPGAPPTENSQRPIPGNPFSGFTSLLASPYLAGIALFVVLLSTTTTLLYIEQARLVDALFTEQASQVRVFAVIDLLVQAGALLAQLFITGRVAKQMGVRVLLSAVPFLVCLGFLGLAMAPVFVLLAAVMVIRRVGEYAFVRPGREMLFAPLDAQSKYKTKNLIDTLVYRGGDAASAWLKSGLDALGHGAMPVALAGAACAAIWGWLGWRLGRQADDLAVVTQQ